MYKKWLICLFGFLTLHLNASDYEVTDIYRNDWENFGLKGKVETIVHLTGKPGKDLTGFSDTRFYSEQNLRFNREGYCSVIQFKDYASGEITVENVYSYGQDGRRLMFSIYGREGKEIFRKQFRYNQSGKVEKEEITYPEKSSSVSDIVSYEYDEQGKPIRKISKNAKSGRMSSSEVITYNENCQPVSRQLVLYSSKGVTKKTTETWTYDSSGHLIISDFSTGNQTQTVSYEYNDAGQIFQEIRSVNGQRQSRKIYHYENGICTAELISDSADRLISMIRLTYDSKGNYTRKVTYRFGENNKKIEVYQIEERKIKYMSRR